MLLKLIMLNLIFFTTAFANTVESVVASATKSKYYIDVDFGKGNTKLDEKGKVAVKAILAEAEKHGKIDEMIVLSWSDTEYPSNSVRTLSKDERKLADKRNREIEKYVNNLDHLKRLDVDTYNMAEKPNSLSRWTKNYDHRIKASLSEQPPLPSKAAHSVILVKMKENL